MFYSRIDSYNRKNVQLGASQHWQMTQTLQPCGFVVVPNLPKLSLRGPQLKNFETPPLHFHRKSPHILHHTPSYPKKKQSLRVHPAGRPPGARFSPQNECRCRSACARRLCGKGNVEPEALAPKAGPCARPPWHAAG